MRLIGLGQPEEVVIDAEGLGTTLSLLNSEEVELVQLTITGGHGEDGAGIHVGAGGTLSTQFVVVRDNHATSCGGGLFSKGLSVELTDTLFTDNLADSCGGGIALGNSPFSATRLRLWKNQAFQTGGGIHIAGGSVQNIRNTWITENSAPTGSALYRDTTGYTRLELSHVAIYSNRGEGAAVAVEDGPLNLLSSMIGYNATEATFYRQEDAFLFPLYNSTWANNVSYTILSPIIQGDRLQHLCRSAFGTLVKR